MKLLKKLFKHKHKWTVIKTIWPFEHGYGTYCKGCRTLLDSGLPKEQARIRCERLNNEA